MSKPAKYTESTMAITYQDWTMSENGQKPLIHVGKQIWIKEMPIFASPFWGYATVKVLIQNDEEVE